MKRRDILEGWGNNDLGSSSRREFKRREMEHELGHEDEADRRQRRTGYDSRPIAPTPRPEEPSSQQEYHLRNADTGKLLSKEGKPSVFSGQRHAQSVAAKLKFGNWKAVPVKAQEGVAEGLNEMDKSAPQPGRDGKVSHSTYGSRDKKGSDYFKGKEAPGKPITKKQMEKDALDILKKQGVAEGSTGVSVRKWANQVRKDHGTDVKFWNRKEGGGSVDSVVAKNSNGEIVGVYNRKTGYPTVFEPKQGVAEGSVDSKYPHGEVRYRIVYRKSGEKVEGVKSFASKADAQQYAAEDPEYSVQAYKVKQGVAETGVQQLKVQQIDKNTGNVTAIDPKTQQTTQLKAADLKPGAQPGTFQTKITDPNAIKAGSTITATTEEDLEQEAVHRISGMGPIGQGELSGGNVESPIGGNEEHDEITKLLTHRLRQLAGLQ